MRWIAIGCAVLLALACGGDSGGGSGAAGGGPGTYVGRGVVRDVQAVDRQLVIQHEDIPGLMPAMTMNFDVADPALLERLAPGQEIRFEVEYTGKVYRVVSAEVLGQVGSAGRSGGPAVEGPAVAERDPAPAFALVDQDGAPLALADLRGEAVVLDFIYTHCPGPCPALTGLLHDARAALPPAARARTRFVSITLDPARDTPAVLRGWGLQRGLDLDGWSLLTGPKETVDDVLSRYGVANVGRPDGEIDHYLVTFLIDPEGNVARRYAGLDHEPGAIAADVERILE